MKLSYQNQTFVCRATFEERHAPKRAGFRFDPERKFFFTRDIQVAARLREHADDSARRILYRKLIDVTPWPGRIRYPKGLKPLHFQPGAARFALSRNRSYLALDPGLGKTIIAALIMNGSPDAWFVYICPPFLCLNVEEEIRKWTTPRRPLRILSRDATLPRGIWIIPDSRLGEARAERGLNTFVSTARRERKRVVLIVDEAHRYSSAKSGRSLYLFKGYLEQADSAIFMSGTPMRNRPLDLFPVLHYAAPETIDFMSAFEYGITYCGGRQNKFGWDFKGATNVKALAAKVMGKFMLRIRDNVLGLDGVKEELLIVGDQMTPALIALDAQLLREHSPEDLMKHIAPNQHVATYRKELGKLTAKEAIPAIKAVLDDTTEKLTVGAYHRDVINYLQVALHEYRPDVISGSVASHRRLDITKAWNAEDGTKVRRPLIMQIDAGGVGFNLQSCDRIIMVESSWVYADNFQFYKRADRQGRKGLVYVQYCVYKNSLGRKIIEASLRKKALADNLKTEETNS